MHTINLRLKAITLSHQIRKPERCTKTNNYSDEELVRLFKETGSNDYMGQLYERYSTEVFRRCLRIVKDKAKAQDLTQDIFLKLISKSASFKEESRFSVWLYSITYNQCRDLLRLNKIRNQISLDLLAEIPDRTNFFKNFELDHNKEQFLKYALDQLTAEERGILMLKYQYDVSVREIAGLFALTESAVKMRILRTKRKINKKHLQGFITLAETW